MSLQLFIRSQRCLSASSFLSPQQGQGLGRKAYYASHKSYNWPDRLIWYYPSRFHQVPKRADPRHAVEVSSHKCPGAGVSQEEEILQTVAQRHKPRAHLVIMSYAYVSEVCTCSLGPATSALWGKLCLFSGSQSPHCNTGMLILISQHIEWTLSARQVPLLVSCPWDSMRSTMITLWGSTVFFSHFIDEET